MASTAFRSTCGLAYGNSFRGKRTASVYTEVSSACPRRPSPRVTLGSVFKLDPDWAPKWQGWQDQHSHRGLQAKTCVIHISDRAGVARQLSNRCRLHRNHMTFDPASSTLHILERPPHSPCVSRCLAKHPQSRIRRPKLNRRICFPATSKAPLTRRGSAEGLGCRPPTDVGFRRALANLASDFLRGSDG